MAMDKKGPFQPIEFRTSRLRPWGWDGITDEEKRCAEEVVVYARDDGDAGIIYIENHSGDMVLKQGPSDVERKDHFLGDYEVDKFSSNNTHHNLVLAFADLDFLINALKALKLTFETSNYTRCEDEPKD